MFLLVLNTKTFWISILHWMYINFLKKIFSPETDDVKDISTEVEPLPVKVKERVKCTGGFDILVMWMKGLTDENTRGENHGG